jgi:hypothetical protein
LHKRILSRHANFRRPYSDRLLATLFLASCANPYVRVTDGTPLSQYSKIYVKLDATEFLATKLGDAHYDGYAASVVDMRNLVTKQINNWLAANFVGKPGAPAALLVLKIDDFYTGSGAARFFLGSMADGHLDVVGKITGGHVFRVNVKIQGFGFDKVMAYNQLAKDTDRYIADHE